MLEVTADVLAARYQDVAAEQQRGRQPAASILLGVDLLLDQLGQHARALGVADEHDAAAVVVVREVVAPHVPDIAVGQCRCFTSRSATDRGEGQLAVDRRVDAAHLGEARGLRNGDGDLVGIDVQVRVDGGLQADGRVHVEAVDRPGLGRGRALGARRAVRGHEGRGAVRRARVVGESGPAEPHRVAHRGCATDTGRRRVAIGPATDQTDQDRSGEDGADR